MKNTHYQKFQETVITDYHGLFTPTRNPIGNIIKVIGDNHSKHSYFLHNSNFGYSPDYIMPNENVNEKITIEYIIEVNDTLNPLDIILMLDSDT